MSLVAPEKLEAVIAALYRAFMVERKPISSREDFMPIVEAVLGKDVAAKILERVGFLSWCFVVSWNHLADRSW